MFAVLCDCDVSTNIGATKLFHSNFSILFLYKLMCPLTLRLAKTMEWFRCEIVANAKRPEQVKTQAFLLETMLIEGQKKARSTHP